MPVVVPSALQLLRGLLMGAADVVPGVSGGTIALVVGIYQRLIDNIHRGAQALGRLIRADLSGALRRLRSIEWSWIIPLGLGIGAAFVALAGIIETGLRDYAEPMAGLFLGLVAGSVVIGWRMVHTPELRHGVVVVVVGVVVFGALGYSSGTVSDPSLLAFFGAGAVAICAMILPGISGSFLLLMLGMYAAVLNVVDERLFTEALVFGAGAVVGLALFSSLLSWLLDEHHDLVMAALVGLMVGSVRVLWPWPNGVGLIDDQGLEEVNGTTFDWPAADEWVWPVVLAVGGFAVVMAISRLAPDEEPAEEVTV